MKTLSRIVIAVLGLLLGSSRLHAYERVQGPTELLYWDKTQTFDGYTLFAAQGTSYLINMEGCVVHTWPVGVNPRLLNNGNLLDASNGDIGGFPGLKEVDWDGNAVWQHAESRTGYYPHHDFLRIYNKKLAAYTTLYVASKAIPHDACIAAGCSPANGAYTNVTVDAVVEVNASGTVVWEWCFFDHGIQDYDASKTNYVGSGKTIASYPGKINLNLPGRPLRNDWLHCVALDYSTNLDQVAITAEGGEFYVVDHGNTFLAGNPAGSIALAATAAGDFLYRFGDPARYAQGSAPSISPNWTLSTTGNKQIGGVSQASWIPAGVPGAGRFLVFNNGQDLFESTPQSYVFEVNGYLNSAGTDTGAYVNPPTAGYSTWTAPGHDTDKRSKSTSKQIVSMFYSMANQAFFSHIGGSVQRLPNGNLLVCSAAEGHIFEATSAGEAVWEYVSPVTATGTVTYKRDNWPLYNAVYRATRYSAAHPALAGRTLTGTRTVAGVAPSYISAPTIGSVTHLPASPAPTNIVTVTAAVTNNRAVASVTLAYVVGSATNTVAMTNVGAVYRASIPKYAGGTLVRYLISAQDDFGNTASTALRSYTVQAGATNLAPVIANVARLPAAPNSADTVSITGTITDDGSVSGATLTYSTGSSTATNTTVFTETMCSTAVKPWTGTGANNAWTVTGSYCEQRTGSNYGSGNACGMEYKGGATQNALTSAMITTTNPINAAGTSGYVEFWLQSLTLDGTDGWTFQLDSGSGYVTRLSELTGSSHGWQKYHYDLAGGELVSTLKMRFQFTGGGAGDDDRIDLDQITVTVMSGGTSSWNVTMYDDSAHADGAAGDGTYGAQIPARPAGTTVQYYLTAVDGSGAATTAPAGAPANRYSYVVSDTSIAFTPKFVHIPGGSFAMGDHFGFVDPDHPSDEVPIHTVSISPLYMSTTLLTCREYCDYLNAAVTSGLVEVRSGVVYAVGGTNIYYQTTASVPLATIAWANSRFTVRSGRDLHPITGVRWFGAIACCNWLSARDGLDACYELSTGTCDMSKSGFRLPTEAEWEFAGRGGQYSPYRQFPWGDDTNADGALANWQGSGDPWENGDYPRTTPVGFYNGALRYKSNDGWPATNATYQTRDGSNAYGLFDMAGNVWEWINDWYASRYYSYCVSNTIVSDPPGPTAGDIFADHGNVAYRGMRGGTWWNGGGQQFYGFSRVSNRDPSWSLGGSPDSNPDSAWLQVGFRVMRPDKAGQTVGLMLNTAACPGYTLLSPMHSTNSYLLNNAGQYVHKWTNTGETGRSSYLQENGHLFRSCAVRSGGPSTGGGEGGRIEEKDWLGNLVWAIDYYSTNYIQHHDFKVLPNGNVLLLVAERKSYADVIAAGFNPSLLDSSVATEGYMLPDCLVEVRPTRPYGGTVVWEWHIWDHMLQHFDPGKTNYYVAADHPERIDVNGAGGRVQQFWNHVNGIDYNAELDQIMLSIRNNSELFVIDHQLTTAQAAGHAGGRYGKGGDILYRWGNPAQYGRGTGANQMLFQQHHAHWLEPGLPGAGHMLIFNNGLGRNYSSVDEIVPPVDAAGNYTRAAGAAYGPAALCWTYVTSPATNFYSAEISGAQRLPNGNTLICEGVKGNLFEVTAAGQTVWRYVCPETMVPLAQGSAVPVDAGHVGQFMNAVFRVTRYPTNHPGLAGKDLTPRGTVETYTGAATDTVGLGLPDLWVRSHFGSLSSVAAASDYDGDGLSDILEYRYGTDPARWSSAGNGLPDGWAVAHAFDPTLASVAALSNPNGYSTLQSYLADLNPADPASRLAIVNIDRVSNDVRLTWIGGRYAWQYLECSPSLTAAEWTSIFTNAPPTGITNSITRAIAPAAARVYYRIRVHR